MIDAWGNIPSGILYLNRMDIGNYRECIKIDHAINPGSSVGSRSVKGKHCFAEFPVGKLLGIPLGAANIRIGICVPSSCKATHMDQLLKQLLQQLLNETYTEQIILPSSCRVAEREPYDSLTIFTIVLLSVLGALVLLATLYDYLLQPAAAENNLPALVHIWSMRGTSRRLFHISQCTSNPNVIHCLNGMRCMSLIWVVFGHEYMVAVLLPNVNQITIANWMQSPFANFALHGPFSVDTFFFLSGLLVVMLGLRAMLKAKGKLNIPLMYLHRYLRLTPALGMAILVYWKILPLLLDGPLADDGFEDHNHCKRTWFWTLLFMQNYATMDICLAHSWYLGVDMQMYILSPLLLLALYKWGKRAFYGATVVLLLLTTWLFAAMMVFKYSTFYKNFEVMEISQRRLYFNTHFHCMPWIIGALFGYVLHVNRGKTFKLQRLVVWAGWLLALAIIFTCIFAMQPYNKWSGPELTQLEDTLYYTLTRIAWPLALCWIVFACMQGYGGMANSFLSSALWQPLSRLSYSAYVWHLFIQELNIRRTQTNTYFSDYEMMLKFWSDFGFTLLLAYVMFLLVEAPFGALEALILGSRSSQTNSATKAATVPETYKKTQLECTEHKESVEKST
ncbi:nose resistant to fluoxetine protein 6 [Drosophila busckii]|nr:nose resistant to fluoxetine protein 6 [Drosophila busckii]